MLSKKQDRTKFMKHTIADIKSLHVYPKTKTEQNQQDMEDIKT